MQDRRVTGAVLIAGVLTMIVGVAAHHHHGPVGSSNEAARRNLVAAVIVVASYGTLAVGFLRLLRSMTPRFWSDVACVALAFAGMCGALAAVAGHVAIPRFLVLAGGGAMEAHAAEAHGNPVVVNQMVLCATLAQASLAAWAIGVLGLSCGMFGGGRGWRIVGASGVMLAMCLLSVLAIGRLEITLHNVGLVVLASGIWVGAIGATLCADCSMREWAVAAPR